jgi:hypothetical protein
MKMLAKTGRYSNFFLIFNVVMEEGFEASGAEAADFDSAIRRFESSRPSQPVLSLAQSATECRRCRHSAPYAADYTVSVSRIWSRMRHYGRLSQGPIFGVSFCGSCIRAQRAPNAARWSDQSSGMPCNNRLTVKVRG